MQGLIRRSWGPLLMVALIIGLVFALLIGTGYQVYGDDVNVQAAADIVMPVDPVMGASPGVIVIKNFDGPAFRSFDIVQSELAITDHGGGYKIIDQTYASVSIEQDIGPNSEGGVGASVAYSEPTGISTS